MSYEQKRQCIKCGCSPLADGVKLYRFPKPGMNNILKCELWAKFMFPSENWANTEFQLGLHVGHKMLCHKHFKRTSFVNYELKLLERTAVPVEKPVESYDDSSATPGTSSDSVPLHTSHLMDITNVEQRQTMSYDASSTTNPGTSQAVPAHTSHLMDITNVEQRQRQTKNISVQTMNAPGIIKSAKEKKYILKCRKNMKKICQLKNRIKKLKSKDTLNILTENNAVKNLTKYLTPSFALILQGQIKNSKRKSSGRRWTMDEKVIALRLYKKSPTCYRLLRRMWCLPAPSTLKVLLGKFKMHVGINEKALSALRKYVDTHEISDNAFTLMWDEMSIKKHLFYNKKEDVIEGFQDHGNHGRCHLEATHGLVFMVSGIRKKIKQPVAYFLSSSFVTADRLTILIKEVLNKCLEFGIDISATVCDMDGVNRRALSLLGASQETPYFSNSNKQIVCMFDPPHLLKCFRNLFMKYDIECPTNISSNKSEGKGIAKWSYIQQFYEIDNMNPNFVFAPSLRRDHLKPNVRQKMKVNLAAQVLSHSVAAGMYAKISQGEIPADAAVTANIIAKMDQLFDSLNADNPDLRRGKPHATNLTNVSPHLNTFKDMKIFFTQSKFLGCNRSPPSQQGWVWTINAVEHLWLKLKEKHNIKSLATRRLQQDPLENLFGLIRSNCGSNTNPTTGQFIAGLKTAILSNLAHIGKGGNCEADSFEAIMNNYKEILSSDSSTDYGSDSQELLINKIPATSASQFPEISLVDEVVSQIEITDESQIDESTGEIQACAYVCGFLLKNIKNKCHNCQNILYSDNNEALVHIFSNFREYNDIKKSLKYASRDLIQCVEHCATAVNEHLKSKGQASCLSKNISQELREKIDFSFLRRCQQHLEFNVNYIYNQKHILYNC